MTGQAEADRLTAKAVSTVWWYFVVLAALTIFLALNTWSHNGLIYELAEWQFERFGRYFPSLTIILLITLAAVLLAIVGIILRLVHRGRDLRPVDDDRTREALALGRLSHTRQFFQTFASLAAIAEFGAFVHYLQLPGPTKEVNLIDLASGAPVRLMQGSIVVRGIEPIGPIVRTSEEIFSGARRSTSFRWDRPSWKTDQVLLICLYKSPAPTVAASLRKSAECCAETPCRAR